MHRPLSEKSHGFVLPAVIMLGLAIMIIAVANLQVIAYNSATLNNQYYKQLAHEAAMAGASIAKSCISKNTTSWTVLTPQIDCSTGTTSGPSSITNSTVGTQDNWSSTYSVAAPDITTDPNELTFASTGTVNLYADSSNTVVAKSFTDTVKVTYQKQSTSGPSTSSSKNIAEVSAGQNSMCAVSEGWAYCWGSNAGGQLGDGTTSQRNSPVSVANNSATIAAINGLCANGTELTSPSATCPDNPNDCTTVFFIKTCKKYAVTREYAPQVPASAMAGHTVTKVSRGNGNHTCAIADGQAYCWGDNTYGQLGTNNTTSSTVPVLVYGAAAQPAKDGICNDNTTFAYGTSNPCSKCTSYFFGICVATVGVKTAAVAPVPAGALAGHTITDISVGLDHTCAIADGQAYCWGENDRGQLGTNNRTDSYKPIAVNTGSSSALSGKVPLTITAGSKYTCSLNTLTPATSQCWGKDEGGQLGDSIAPPPSSTAINHSGGTASKDYGPNNMIPVGYYRATAICTVAGTFNNNKPTPDPSVTDTLLPVDVNMRSSKYSRTWSYGTYTIPTDRAGSPLSGLAISSVKAGGYITPLLANGKLYWFGGPDHTEDRNNNVSGYYETCSTYYSKWDSPCNNTNETPSCGDVHSTSTYVTLRVGTSIFDDGSLLGVYSLKYVYHMNSTATPLYASSSNLSSKSITQVSGQNQSSDSNAICMLTDTNTLYCGGGVITSNSGQLGDGNTSGTRTNSSDVVPVKMTGVLSGKTITRIVSNSTGDYTCVVATDPATSKGGVYCWGSGAYGRTGMGDTANRYEPTSVDISVGSAIGGGTTPGPSVTKYVNPVTY